MLLVIEAVDSCLIPNRVKLIKLDLKLVFTFTAFLLDILLL